MNLIENAPDSVKQAEPQDDKTIIRRHRRDKPWTEIENKLLQDHTLTLQTKGLLVTLISMPETWRISKAWIKDRYGIGDHRVDGMFNEARKHGYMHYTVEKGPDGKFSEHVYTICDYPIFLNKNKDPNQYPENHPLDNSTTPGKTSTGKSTARKNTPLQKKQSTNDTGDKILDRSYAVSKTKQRWIELAKKEKWDSKTKSLYREFVERWGHEVVVPPSPDDVIAALGDYELIGGKEEILHDAWNSDTFDEVRDALPDAHIYLLILKNTQNRLNPDVQNPASVECVRIMIVMYMEVWGCSRGEALTEFFKLLHQRIGRKPKSWVTTWGFMAKTIIGQLC